MSLNSLAVLLFFATSYAFEEDTYYWEPPTLAPRVTWMARPPARPLADNVLPAGKVIVQHTGGEECGSPGECVKRVLDTQTYHVDSLDLPDVAYNFLIGGDGVVYVGRGWYKRGDNDPSAVEIAFVGNFADRLPSDEQLQAFTQLVETGSSLDLLAPEFVLTGHCQLETSSSPGAALLDLMKSWPHFDPSLPTDCYPGIDFSSFPMDD